LINSPNVYKVLPRAISTFVSCRIRYSFAQFSSAMRHILKTALFFACLIPYISIAQNQAGKYSQARIETIDFTDTARYREKNLEIGLSFNVLHYQGDLSVDQKPFDGTFSPAGGIFLRKHLIPNLALRANVLVGTLSENDLAYPDRGTTFKTSLSQASLQAEWDVFGKSRFRHPDTVGYILDRYQQIASINKFRHLILPYLFAGGSATSTKAKATFQPGYAESVSAREKVAEDLRSGSGRKTNFGLLFGGGLDFDLGPNWMIGGELSLHTSFSDYLDGVSFSGNPARYDWFWAGGLHLSYRLGKKDRDGDGIADAKDRCPHVPGTGRSLGCPDADQDGIADRDDECPHRPGIVSLGGCPMKDADNDSVPDVDDLCPHLAGVVALHGCPDADADGIEDRADECPALAGLATFHGCPDIDNDGVEDRQDSCKTIAGLALFQGCPDTDGDGVEDRFDACPKDSGAVVFYKGCPVRDTDGDGVEDKLDPCPTIAGKAEFKGCPDRDGDGVEDRRDICPSVAGKIENRGCPPIEKKDRQKLELAVKAVKFETGKAVLKPASGKILQDIAKILVKYSGYHLRISGHTDSQGNDAANQLLSESRAQACADFLATRGIDKGRLKAIGLGETKPVASNKTAQGRTNNRRVEFELVFPEEKE